MKYLRYNFPTAIQTTVPDIHAVFGHLKDTSDKYLISDHILVPVEPEILDIIQIIYDTKIYSKKYPEFQAIIFQLRR